MLPPAPGLLSTMTVWPSSCRDRLADDARQDVGGAAGRERHDDGDRLGSDTRPARRRAPRAAPSTRGGERGGGAGEQPAAGREDDVVHEVSDPFDDRWRCPGRRRCTWCTGRSGRRCGASWLTAVVTSRAPLAPSGWPSAMAPPLGLTRGSSSASPRSRSTASPCAANASLSSMVSICSRLSPVSASTFLTAGAGPNPMMRGASPAVAMPTTRAFGVSPCFDEHRLAGQQAARRRRR